MALKPCRECRQEVSTEAKTCPHCGTPNPTTPKATAKDTLAGLVVLALIAAGTVVTCSDSDDEKKAKAKKADDALAKCRQDLACIGEKVSISASGACAREVERLAKNSMRWTDKSLESKFSHYRWGTPDKTHVTLLGDKAQFQNGFGAYINVVYACDVDVQSYGVGKVDVQEGRL
ncbi:MAG: zinc ribbon domain-containing protein [Burkholderiales bacterium]|nr:zinc ribbon domain-containing protein [Burkholderiales bacterium]